MVFRFIFIFLTFISIGSVYGQINIQWESRVNGEGNYIDKAIDLALDIDGNTYVTGTSFGADGYDILTVKYDADGTELWKVTYGSAGIDEAQALALDSNNDLIVTGAVNISDTDWDIVTIKYDGETGAELWVETYAGSDNYDFGKDIAVDDADNVIVVGSKQTTPSNVDFIVLKYSTLGVLLWDYELDAGLADEAKVVAIGSENNIYVGGHSEFDIGSSFFNFRLVKLSPLGSEFWSVSFDSGYNNLDTPNAIAIDGAGHVILGGQGFTDILNEEDYLTMKFNGVSGSLMWRKIYAGDAEALDKINAVTTDNDNNVYVTGKSKSITNSEDFYTIAYSAFGVELWADRYSTDGLRYDEAKDLVVNDAGTFLYVSGFSFDPVTNNDFTTIKYNLDGERQWITRFDGPSSNSDQALKLKLDASDNIFVTGNSHGGATNLDFSTIKYCQLTTLATPDTSVCLGSSIDLTATGGTNVTWTVLSGDAASMSCDICPTMTATPSETSTYVVSSESLSGCVDYDTVLVSVNPLPVPTIDTDESFTICDGDSIELRTDAYLSYLWSNGSDSISTVVSTADEYTVLVTDENGCDGFASQFVFVNELPAVDAGADVFACRGDTVFLAASGADLYSWEPDPSLSDLDIADPIALATEDATYIVLGTNVSGCFNRDTIQVNRWELPPVNAGADESICLKDSVHLLVTGATDYSWTSHPTLSALDIPDPWATPLTITEYFVVGTDDNGCKNIDSITISTISLPNINVGPDTSICLFDSLQFFATGGLVDMYIWSPDEALMETDVYNPYAKPSETTSFFVKGTDINGCSNYDTITVVVNELPLISAGEDDYVCPGDETMLMATGGVSYSWEFHPTLSETEIANPMASPIVLTTYTVVGTDINGCSNSDEVEVTVNELPDVYAGPDEMICFGDTVQLNAEGALIYVWVFEESLSNFLIADPLASPDETIDYIVSGIDEFGCKNSDTLTVTVNDLPDKPILTKEGVYLISSSENGNQWYWETDELVGEVNDSLDYTTVGLNGMYWVLLTDENGCIALSDTVFDPLIVTDVSIKEFTPTLNWSVYPNPVVDILNVNGLSEVDALRIFNISGQLVQEIALRGQNNVQIDVRDLTAGTYLVQAIQGNQLSVLKFIVD
jgi:hypothetical protein